jgi:hypothetical protein
MAKKKRIKIKNFLLLLAVMTGFMGVTIQEARAFICPCEAVLPLVRRLHRDTNRHITNGFLDFQQWLTDVFFEENLLPALMMMTEQLSSVAIQQVEIIGMFLDAKHQLETQRLFQQLQARAHKDYHPSEGLCVVGTNVRSLASSDRAADFGAIAISNRTMQRQMLSGDLISSTGPDSDRLSRLDQFRKTYCNPDDNALGLKPLCQSGGPADRRNKDIDFTRTVETPLTLNLDFTDTNAPTPDEEDVFALAAYLYAHEVPSQIPESYITDPSGNPIPEGATAFMNLRSIIAKRSVAQNSFASIAAQKSLGDPEVRPFLYAILKDMGLPDAEITEILGEQPSYFAQMEVLTKKLYQHPNFYTELYDKPVNVKRKQVAMQAIDLMQKRDTFRSLLRSEAIMSVLLEMEVMKEQEKIRDEVDQLSQRGSGSGLN